MKNKCPHDSSSHILVSSLFSPSVERLRWRNNTCLRVHVARVCARVRVTVGGGRRGNWPRRRGGGKYVKYWLVWLNKIASCEKSAKFMPHSTAASARANWQFFERNILMLRKETGPTKGRGDWGGMKGQKARKGREIGQPLTSHYKGDILQKSHG